MNGPLEPARGPRADLAMLTHARVMETVAGLLTAGEEVTYRALAERSGIAERTLYRHFATKDELLAAFWQWLRRDLAVPEAPRSAQELLAQIPLACAAFERREPLIRAMLHDVNGRATRVSHAPARRKQLREALAEVLQPLPRSRQTQLLASIQAIASAAGWETMRDYWGLTSSEVAAASQWAVGALIEAAEREGDPQHATAREKKKGKAR